MGFEFLGVVLWTYDQYIPRMWTENCYFLNNMKKKIEEHVTTLSIIVICSYVKFV